MYQWVTHVNESRFTHLNMTWFAYKRVTLHMYVPHIPLGVHSCIHESHMWMSHVSHIWMRHGSHIYSPYYIRTCHVTHTSRRALVYQHVLYYTHVYAISHLILLRVGQVWHMALCYVLYMLVSCHTCLKREVPFQEFITAEPWTLTINPKPTTLTLKPYPHREAWRRVMSATHGNTRQHTATHCNALQHTATSRVWPGANSCQLTHPVKVLITNLQIHVDIHIYVSIYVH